MLCVDELNRILITKQSKSNIVVTGNSHGCLAILLLIYANVCKVGPFNQMKTL